MDSAFHMDNIFIDLGLQVCGIKNHHKSRITNCIIVSKQHCAQNFHLKKVRFTFNSTSCCQYNEAGLNSNLNFKHIYCKLCKM